METILRIAMAANVMITLANAENDNKSSDKNVINISALNKFSLCLFSFWLMVVGW